MQVGDPFAEKLLLEACLELMASRLRHRHPGHGRGRAHLLGGRDGRQGRPRHRARPRQGAGARDRHERLRDDALGKPGAHAHGAQAREGGRGRGDLPKWGLDFAIVGHTTTIKRFVRQAWRRGHGRPADQGTRRRGAGLRPAACRTPSRCRRCRRATSTPPMRHRRCAGEADRLAGPLLASAGSGSSTTTSSSATPCSGRAAMPPWCASRTGRRALAFTVDVTPRYCEADPFEGGKQAVAEAWRNLTAVGGRPLAATDNLNFGNPERPEIMGQFVGCVHGIGEACQRARLPGRVGQRLALQRDQRPRHPADADHRRRRPARRLHEVRDAGLQGARTRRSC